jgi:DNA-binding MarR family transcriptional regulator
VSDPARPRAARTGRSTLPSRAAGGVVDVAQDFTDEYPDGDPLAARLIATLVKTGHALDDEFERCMVASFEAGQNVLNTLAVIDGAGESLTPTQIGERAVFSSATTTGTLDALERRGWIRRMPNPDDRRSVLVETTAEGRAVADEFLPGIRALELVLLSELTDRERTTLLRLLGKVLDGLVGAAERPPTPLTGRRVRPGRLGQGD